MLFVNNLFLFCLDEPDKIKKEAFKLKLNEYTKRAEELKATLFISKVKINSDKTAEKLSSSSSDEERSPTLSNLFLISNKINLFYKELLSKTY